MSFKFIAPSDGWLIRSRDDGSTDQVLITHDGGDTWMIADTGDVVPDAAQFVDANNGWISGTIYKNCGFALQCPSRLLITHDGGRTWGTAGGPTASGHFSIEFVDQSDGWALVECRENCPLYRTQDGGGSWERMDAPQRVSPLPHQVQRIDAKVAWVSGGGILVTPDGGQTWHDRPDPCALTQPVQPGRPFVVDQVDFISVDIGWVACTAPTGNGAGYSTTNLYRTSDGGLTWAMGSSQGDPNALADQRLFHLFGRVQFTDPASGWGASWLQGVWRTSDGGRTWQPVGSPVHAVLEIDFLDAARGWVGDHERIAGTTDAGAHWQSITLPP